MQKRIFAYTTAIKRAFLPSIQGPLSKVPAWPHEAEKYGDDFQNWVKRNGLTAIAPSSPTAPENGPGQGIKSHWFNPAKRRGKNGPP
jgi:hypothetical protein